MTIEQLHAYFEDIATHHKKILHTPSAPGFKRDSLDNLLAATRSALVTADKFALILENPQGNFEDNISDSPKDFQTSAFWIIKLVPKGDEATELQVRSMAKSIGVDVISKMRKDMRQIPKHPVLQWININSIQYNPLSNVLDGCSGYRFEFTLHEHIDLSFQPSNWTY